MLKAHITAIHQESDGTYGSPRVHGQLRHDFDVGRDRAARLMRELQLCGTPKRRFRSTTDSAHDAPVAPNLLQRDFEAEHPNQRWATDITYVWTSQSWMYLAVIMDLFSRRVVGWAMAPHLRTDLALDALRMALGASPQQSKYNRIGSHKARKTGFRTPLALKPPETFPGSNPRNIIMKKPPRTIAPRNEPARSHLSAKNIATI